MVPTGHKHYVEKNYAVARNVHIFLLIYPIIHHDDLLYGVWEWLCWLGFTKNSYPNAPDWENQEQGVPNHGAKAVIYWKMDYGVAITDFTGYNAQASQIVSAQLKDTYQVIIQDNICSVELIPLQSPLVDHQIWSQH